MTLEALNEQAKIAGAARVLLRRGLQGIAAAPLGRRAARFATSGAGGGALAGAGVGAATGAASAAAQGGDIKDMARRGALGAAGGAVLGGVGGAAGRGVRDTKLLNAGMGTREAVGETGKRVGRSIKNLGRRQLHGITGKGDAQTMGFVSSTRNAEKANLAKLRYADTVKHESKGKNFSPKKSLKRLADHQEVLKELKAEGRRGDEYIGAGIRSLPGLAKGVRKDPKRVAKALYGEATEGGPVAATLGLAAPIALTAPSLARGDESATGGLNMKQKSLRLGAAVGGGLLTGGLPILPQIAADTLVDRATNTGSNALKGKQK